MRSDDWDKRDKKETRTESLGFDPDHWETPHEHFQRKFYEDKPKGYSRGRYYDKRGNWIDITKEDMSTKTKVGRITKPQKGWYQNPNRSANESGRCTDCKGKIGLTDVEGHYSGECKGCRWEFMKKIDDYHGRGLT